MSENDTQVGGTHYKKDGDLQHWDLVIRFQWDYFQAQIVKYLMRWKFKHATSEKRLEDLKKAQHFLSKYIENYESYDSETPVPASDQWILINSDVNFRTWGCSHCSAAITVLGSRHPPKDHVCPAEPQARGYVDQDQC